MGRSSSAWMATRSLPPITSGDVWRRWRSWTRIASAARFIRWVRRPARAGLPWPRVLRLGWGMRRFGTRARHVMWIPWPLAPIAGGSCWIPGSYTAWTGRKDLISNGFFQRCYIGHDPHGKPVKTGCYEKIGRLRPWNPIRASEKRRRPDYRGPRGGRKADPHRASTTGAGQPGAAAHGDHLTLCRLTTRSFAGSPHAAWY